MRFLALWVGRPGGNTQAKTPLREIFMHHPQLIDLMPINAWHLIGKSAIISVRQDCFIVKHENKLTLQDSNTTLPDRRGWVTQPLRSTERLNNYGLYYKRDISGIAETTYRRGEVPLALLCCFCIQGRYATHRRGEVPSPAEEGLINSEIHYK